MICSGTRLSSILNHHCPLNDRRGGALGCCGYLGAGVVLRSVEWRGGGGCGVSTEVWCCSGGAHSCITASVICYTGGGGGGGDFWPCVGTLQRGQD